MDRRQFMIGGLTATLSLSSFSAWARPQKQGQLQWLVRIKG